VEEAKKHAPHVRSVSGRPAFVAAHGIANEGMGLSFDQAYALTCLVFDYGGGPITVKPRSGVIPKAIVVALTHAGLVEVEGSSQFTQRVHVRLSVGGRVGELLDAKYAGVVVTPIEAREKSHWLAVATRAGFDLVAKHLP
jgi:hypothetical protein